MHLRRHSKPQRPCRDAKPTARGALHVSEPRTPSRKIDLPLLLALWLFEFSVVLAVFALYNKGERSFAAIAGHKIGKILVFAIVAAGMSLVFSLWRCLRPVHGGRRRALLTCGLGVFVTALTFTVVEVALRAVAKTTPRGEFVGSLRLLPKNWNATSERIRAVLDETANQPPFLVHHPILGWTIGKSRSGANGESFSSTEGLRSAVVGISYSDRQPEFRIALVGDSHTFGNEIRFEETWGHQLETLMGPDVQVLNFGVDGYGVDQAFLRYREDVRAWKPDLVIFGLSEHDLYRSISVYGFLVFPESDFPFAKPRFTLTSDGLELINVPVLQPGEILASASIHELPFVSYDASYERSKWQRQFYHSSYAVRFALSRFQRRSFRPQVNARMQHDLNAALLDAFARLAESEGSTPLLVYLPTKLASLSGRSEARGETFSQQILRGAEYPQADLTRCLEEVDPADRYGIGHYTPHACVVVARCLRDEVARLR